MAAAASRDTLSAAPLLMLAGDEHDPDAPRREFLAQRVGQGGEAAWLASSGPANGGLNRTPIVLMITIAGPPGAAAAASPG